MYYLIKDSENMYTISNSELVNLGAVSEISLTASYFTEHGFTDISDTSLILTLSNPQVMAWSEADFDIQADITYSPPLPQYLTSVYSLFDTSVTGINEVILEGSDDIGIRFAFTDSDTFYYWDAAEQCFKTSDNVFNTKSECKNIIPFSEINGDAVRGLKVQVVFPAQTSYLSGITINFLN